jgi:hypothetical protein
MPDPDKPNNLPYKTREPQTISLWIPQAANLSCAARSFDFQEPDEHTRQSIFKSLTNYLPDTRCRSALRVAVS